jgi:hypothetical protein
MNYLIIALIILILAIVSNWDKVAEGLVLAVAYPFIKLMSAWDFCKDLFAR